jgi:uncharacterized repeat protein (TIGR01451 family)
MGRTRGRTGRWFPPLLVCAVGVGLLGAAPDPAAPQPAVAANGSAVAGDSSAAGADSSTVSSPAAATPAGSDSADGSQTSATSSGADSGSDGQQAATGAGTDSSTSGASGSSSGVQNGDGSGSSAATGTGTSAVPAVNTPAVKAPVAVKPAGAPQVQTQPQGSGSGSGQPCPTGCRIRVHKKADRTYYLPGQTVHYTVTVTDIGSQPCPPETVTDNISGDLADGVFQHDASTASGSTSYHQPDLVWTTGALSPGQTVTMTYSVVADNPDLGPKRLIDSVTAPNSNCVTGEEYGCHVKLGSPSWVVTKRENTEDVEPGNHIDYVITAHNTGTVDFTGIRQAGLEDDMSLIVKDSVYDADATASTGTITVDKPYVRWRGDLPAGDSVTIKLSIRAEALPPHTSVLENIVRALYPHHGGTDLSDPLPPLQVQHSARTRALPAVAQLPFQAQAPEQPGLQAQVQVRGGGSTSTVPLIEACTVNPRTDSCDVTADEPKLVVRKSANRQNAAPGQVVTYRVAFANLGDNDFPSSELPVVTDDLSQVLSVADFVPGSLKSTVPSASFDAAQQKIVWTGELLAGQHGYFQYQVRVDKPFHGKRSLDNLVVAPGSNCQSGSTDSACRVHVPVVKRFFHELGRGHFGGLAFTGADVAPAASLGGGLLLSGLGLVLYRRRLRRH